jgi:hypothetical protein
VILYCKVKINYFVACMGLGVLEREIFIAQEGLMLQFLIPFRRNQSEIQGGSNMTGTICV